VEGRRTSGPATGPFSSVLVPVLLMRGVAVSVVDVVLVPLVVDRGVTAGRRM